MTYFKVISGGEAVDAGCMWLEWNARHNCLMACEPNKAHYAQSYDGKTVYRIGWLNPLPDGAPVYPTVEAKIIDWQEYDELIAAFDGGETVPEPPEPEPEPEPEPQPEPQPEPDRPMSIAEMREAITQMQAEINGENMTAYKHIRAGTYFNVGMRIYQATDAIVKGEALQPGRNCIEVSMATALNELNTGKENE